MQNFQNLKQQSPVDGWDHQDPEEAFTLPSRYFYDDTLFKAERDNIFMHAWHVAGHVSEFAEPGQFVVTDLFDQSVVVAKNRQGQIHAFHNVCQHRGNRLLEERRGTTGGVVRCAYHSWCYEMDGSLRSAPRCEKMKNFELQQFNIPQIRTEEMGGFIYFNLDPNAPSLRDLFPGADEEMRRVFPDRPIVDLTDDHPIFHTLYDLRNMTKVQIPNMNSLMAGGPGWMSDGRVPRWRGISDDTGRLMVLIAFNNDVMDAWQWADDSRYPGDLANTSLRLGVNVVIYAMTH